MFPPEVIAQEKRHERISAIITSVLMAILFILLYFAVYTRARDLALGEDDEYEVVGAIDFGDYREGNQQVNTAQPATRNATPTPPQQTQPQPATSTPQPAQQTPTNTNIPAPSEVVTTEAPAPVNVPPPTPTPKPKPAPPSNPTPSPPTSTPTETPTPPTPAAPAPAPQEDLEFDFNTSGGGSNDGKNGDVGNKGNTDTPVFNPGGGSGFASGEGGLKGRGIININTSRYTGQQEGVITFEIIIGADGSVANVKAIPPIPPNSSQMVRHGQSNIRRWRFESVPGSGFQKVKYTMTFKLN